MNNNKDYLKFMLKVLLISVIPMMAVVVLLTPYLSDLALWFVAGGIVLLAYAIGYALFKRKKTQNKDETDKKAKFDPYSD